MSLLQAHWNNIAAPERLTLYARHKAILDRLFRLFGLDCRCVRCGAVMTLAQLEDAGAACCGCGRNSVTKPQ